MEYRHFPGVRRMTLTHAGPGVKDPTPHLGATARPGPLRGRETKLRAIQGRTETHHGHRGARHRVPTPGLESRPRVVAGLWARVPARRPRGRAHARRVPAAGCDRRRVAGEPAARGRAVRVPVLGPRVLAVLQLATHGDHGHVGPVA